jgi:predicted GNAT superfamily acetyltransferase
MNIQYRFLNSHEDYRACVALQKHVWGFEDNLDMVPIPLLVIGRKNGGFLYGAFDGNQLVGFIYSILGMYNNKLIHCSHMLAVIPEYQNQSIGYKLKMKQREFALAQGIDLITWTYDPFQVKNAFFNIEKLGAVVRNYYPDLYGETSSRIHWGLPTDRMLAEWYLNSERATRLAQNPDLPERIDLHDAITCTVLNDSLTEFAPEYHKLFIEMPADFADIVNTDKQTALQLVLKIRTIMMQCFAKHLYVKRFVALKTDSNNHYGYYLQRD